MRMNKLKLIVLLGVFASYTTSCSVQNNVVKTPSTKNPTKPTNNTTPPKVPVVTTKPTTGTTAPTEENFRTNLPEIKREFRGAWIASVANINWPSRNDLTVEQQKAEAISMLDMLRDNNFNAAIFQIRPSADALYTSNLEPWSYFLTGETGKAPSPNYDPLQFWIEEAHKRGLELHVWLNPYRAHHTNGGAVNSLSMVNKLSDIVVKLKNGMYWFDPANPKTQGHVSNVVRDIVKRYDIDAVHFDDYFYPYATYNKGADFPDNASWNAYVSSGGTLSRADWRRDNVNKFVERIYKEIHAEKNNVRFGISPFGIWKPGYPAGVVGSSQYDELYADAKLWLNKGWVDYFSPQLYWPVDSKGQSFEALLSWWQSENTMNRHLWPGLNTVEIKVSDRPAEIKNQIAISRNILKNDAGEIHWSIAGLTKNPNMLPALKNGPYSEKALVPKSPWIKAVPLQTPTLFIADNGSFAQTSWSTKNAADVFQWVLFTQYNGIWQTEILTLDTLSKDIPKFKDGKKLSAVAIKAIDRLGNESDYIARKIK
ncbi:glycoside hydrolase family 10 protein [Chryseobacterium viscerum]|uniref:glycoside hydrolase family 10 protein n=1 Tax=Chryseobacterium viscerum TaxID=1037377 RepID=UPI0022220B5D|nr:family 10 glycosylhydrolase [Chryseobacterium viscerum]MCW1961748.1 family 10 glycosylhydrolase [Chryseobacterium viscerum]